jgi:hypothetical protein
MKYSTRGQAVILLILALGIFLLGAVGLAVESSHYYTHRQMAQAAADAAAQAAITSIYSRTNTGTNLMDGTPFTCVNGTDLRTPCHFARQHGFGRTGSADVVAVDFPASAEGVGDLSSDSPAIVGVTISRAFNSGLLRLIGAAGATVTARGVAAILIEISPVPILVMHPDEPESFHINGNPTVQICGGPPRSIQVNSISATSFSVQGGGGGANTVDLSGAGPGGTLLGCNGSGGEFGNHGGPFNYSVAQNGYPGGTLLPATANTYLQTLPIDDPLAIPMPDDPAVPTELGSTVPVTGGTGGCPLASPTTCTLLKPGLFTSDITIKNDMALLDPGVYYIQGGFSIEANGIVHMAPCVDSSSPNWSADTGCGVLIYLDPQNANDIVDIRSNAGQLAGVAYSQTLTVEGLPVNCTGNCLQGPPEAAPYWGVVFMVDRSTVFAQEHSFQGGGGLTIAGTLYFTNSFLPGKADLTGSSDFQKVILQGTPGSTTQVVGQILVDSLELAGNATIRMTLNPNSVHPIRKLALIR